MDDYYSMLGVDAGASVDDIRDAYRTRKNGLDTGSDAGKVDAAKLNKAWNVLSDPYQRGRYDEKRTRAIDDDEIEDADEIEVRPASSRNSSKNNARMSRQEAARERRAAMKGPPTIPAPPGTHYPKQKQRILAMSIDLGVIIVLFVVAAYMVAPAISRSQKPDVVDRIDQLQKTVNSDTTASDAANKVLSDAKKGTDQSAIKTAQDKADAAKKTLKDDNDALTKEQDKLTPISLTVIGAAFLVGLLYLVIPSGLTGRTFGKARQHLKVVRQDGSPLRMSNAFSRYGLIVVATIVLFFILRLGPLGAVIVLFGVTMWTRNPNQQGMHDRFAHTIVVADDE